jgi:hypothetical protein
MMEPYAGRSRRRINANAWSPHLADEEQGRGGSMIETMMAPYDPKDKDMDEQSAMTIDSPYGQDALITGMERTFFSAMNNSWLLVFAGVGLMSVGHNDDHAVNSGTFLFAAGTVMAFLACAMHVCRIAQIKLSVAFPLGHSALWAITVSSLVFVALGLELYFAIKYPYLNRSQAVVVETAPPSSS